MLVSKLARPSCHSCSPLVWKQCLDLLTSRVRLHKPCGACQAVQPNLALPLRGTVELLRPLVRFVLYRDELHTPFTYAMHIAEATGTVEGVDDIDVRARMEPPGARTPVVPFAVLWALWVATS